jgi:Fic family protein
VFHHEFEFIHPFAEGNGRVGRLWQTMILARWKPLFAQLPVESVVRDRQAEYYAALAAADTAGDAAPFVRFMLEAIREALAELPAAERSQKSAQNSSQKILSRLARDPSATIAKLAAALGVSDRAVKKHLAALKVQGKLRRIGPDKGGHWEVI